MDKLLENYLTDDELFNQEGRFINRDTGFKEYDLLKRLFFPKQWDANILILRKAYSELSEILYTGLEYDKKQAHHGAILDKLPQIRSGLKMDVEAAYNGDPAASSYTEIIRNYPGMAAMIVQRLAHEIYAVGAKTYARELNEQVHSLTGIDIHPGAEIGHHFFIDHGSGVVIGETSVIGNFVRLYQNVTLGALHFKQDKNDSSMLAKNYKRHPTIGDYVVIGAGAKILGAVTIGSNVNIGANSWIQKNIQDNTNVYIVEHPPLKMWTNGKKVKTVIEMKNGKNEKMYDDVGELVGDTPIIRLDVTGPEDAALWGKLEYTNPGFSVKDRIALSMINHAEKDGLRKGDTIVEATSGNTGIGLAMIAANRGYKIVLTMPIGVSEERKKLLRHYGAELILVKPEEGVNMTGAVRLAGQLAKEHGYYYMRQFENPANPLIHEKTTGPEIVAAFRNSGLTLDYFVAGIGTGGTITGAGKVLRDNFPDIRIYGVEPSTSQVLAGKEPGPHPITGIGAGFVPKILNTKIYDGLIPVSFDEAKTAAENLAKKGILGGISSGAATYAALQVVKDKGKEKNALVILPSNGERYLSTKLFETQ